MRKKVPKKLQGILWSADVNLLDLEKNKSYIINQILSFGRLEELDWLFKTYPVSVIKETFIDEPTKTYTYSSFNFCKNILLSVKNKKLSPDFYVRSLPRRLGQ